MKVDNITIRSIEATTSRDGKKDYHVVKFSPEVEGKSMASCWDEELVKEIKEGDLVSMEYTISGDKKYMNIADLKVLVTGESVKSPVPVQKPKGIDELKDLYKECKEFVEELYTYSVKSSESQVDITSSVNTLFIQACRRTK